MSIQKCIQDQPFLLMQQFIRTSTVQTLFKVSESLTLSYYTTLNHLWWVVWCYTHHTTARRKCSHTTWSFTWRDPHCRVPVPQILLPCINKCESLQLCDIVTILWKLERKNKRKRGGKPDWGETQAAYSQMKLSYFYTVRHQKSCPVCFCCS